MRHGPNGSHLASRVARVAGVLLLSCGTLLAEPKTAESKIDESQLPPASTNRIDFARDIQPIFDTSCLRCHGPAKPKSGFRLDSRATALKGGDDGVDIVPGNSAKSPLIHFTAGLVEDMQMPPEGKGEPLTAAQIGLLRAWIDQGAPWNSAPPTNLYSVSFSPVVGGTTVSGDAKKFRELNWRPEGVNGGLGEFQLFQQTGPDTAVLLSGHALRDDHKIDLSIEQTDLGFIHSGWEEYRKYYDNLGGFRHAASTPEALSLDQDLHLTLGKAWVDFGVSLPHWPRLVFGYEYDYKRGDEASTAWGVAGTAADARNIGPASRGLREGTHVLKFDLDAEVKGVTIEDRFRGEFYSLNTHYTNSGARGPLSQNVDETDHYFQGANTIRLEKQFKNWMFASAGYLYSHLDADSSFTNVTRFFNTSFAGSAPSITLERESHVANVNLLLGPFDGLTLSGGAQTEWTRQQGFGSGNLNEIPFSRTPPLTLAIVSTTLNADYDERSAMETAALRYTKIPFTVLFAEVRLEQDSIGQTDSDLQSTGNFAENTDFSSQLTDFRVGFSTSPWRWMTFSAHYRRYENDSHYPRTGPPQPDAGGYPDFFRSRELLTDETETKLVVRPCNWLKTTLSCQFLTTDFRDDANAASNVTSHVVFSPAGNTLTGRFESEIYSIATVLTPHPRVYFTGSFSYEPSQTRDLNSHSPTIGPYHGDTYSADASSTYVLSQNADFSLGWNFSEASYAQKNGPTVVPVDIRYQEHGVEAALARRFGKNVTARLQYNFDYYHEPSSGGAADFRAHTVFATLNLRLP
jgi:hypothetical protein